MAGVFFECGECVPYQLDSKQLDLGHDSRSGRPTRLQILLRLGA